MKKLYLVDVSSMFFRAYYAVRPLSTSKGLPTNAVYGFLSMVVKLLKDIKPDYIAFCFDRPEPSFRKEIYDLYKANRSEMPEDLIPQVPYIKQVSEALGIPMFERPRFEADDLIGTLTHFGQQQKLHVVIVSGDKDFSQLINPSVTMHDTMKDIVFDEAKVLEKWGVKAQNFIDYLALTGDSSDNIPGVNGIGPKGAQKLIDQFGDLETLYAKIDEIKNPKLQQKLLDSKDMAFLSKELVTIKTDMDLNVNLEALKLKPIQQDVLEKLLEELEFQTFKKNLLGSREGVSAPVAAETSTLSVSTPSAERAATAIKARRIAESEADEWFRSQTRMWIVDHQREYIFAAGDEVVIYGGDEDRLRKILEKSVHLIWEGFDLKSTWRQLQLSRRQVAGWDSFLAAYVVRAGAVESFQEVYAKYVTTPLPELPEATQLYQAQLDLKQSLAEELRRTQMEQILNTIELPVIDLLAAMEAHGVMIDVDFLKKESADLAVDIKTVEAAIHQAAGETFNVASPKQLAHVLFEKMGLPKGKKTKTGYSTNTDVLENLESEFPIAAQIIQYRELAKLKSTYVDALPVLVNPQTGRVHTQYNQALTSTGRLSSVHPNLQNIPIRTERGQRIRRAFVASPGHVLVSADYSQIELRILAHISSDKGLTEAFERDIDIHTKAASEIFEVPLEEVGEDLRRKAKAVNFGIAYGQGVFGLSETLKIPRSEAKQIIDTYFERFAGVKKYMNDITKFVEEHGYVETILGRRRYLPEIRSKNRNIKAFAERAAINAPIQGMASDLVKLAMIEVGAEFREQLLLQVHDELIFELPDDETLPEKMIRIRSGMENCMQLAVPLKVNISSGPSWADI